MNEAANLKRRGFRFHLSTVILMCLAAGCMIPLNWRPMLPHSDPSLYGRVYGWPIMAIMTGQELVEKVELSKKRAPSDYYGVNVQGGVVYSEAMIVLDIGFQLVLILLFGSACEW